MLNRRHLFGASAAVAVASLPLAVAAASPEVDRIQRDYEALYSRYQKATQVSAAAYKRYADEKPLAPTACKIMPRDVAIFGGAVVHGVGQPISPKSADWLRAYLEAPQRTKVGCDRAHEILAARQAWDDEELAVSIRTGLRDASDREDDLADELFDMEKKIVALGCPTAAHARLLSLLAKNNPDNDIGSDAAFAVAAFVLNGGLN